MIQATHKGIEFLLKDERNCRSKNLKKFFRNNRNRNMKEVILFEDQLWFVSLGWRVNPDCDTGFAGVRVREVACQGLKARSGYPYRQNGNDYKIVTDWFWDNYIERGTLAFPDIWNIRIPPVLTYAEAEQTKKQLYDRRTESRKAIAAENPNDCPCS